MQRLGCPPHLCRLYRLALFCCHSSQCLQARRDQFFILDPLENQKALLVEAIGCCEVALHRGNARQSDECFGRASLIPYFLEGASALLEEGMRLGLLTLPEPELPQKNERVGSCPGIVDLLQQAEALLGQAAGGSYIALREKEQASLQVEYPAEPLFVAQGPVERQALLQQSECLVVLALHCADAGQLREAAAMLPLLPHLLVEARRLLQLRPGKRIPSPCPGARSQDQEGIRHATFVSHFPEEVQALAAQFLCPFRVVQEKGQICCRIECPGLHRCLHSLTKRQSLFQKVLPFSAIPTYAPEPGQRGTEAQGTLRLLLA